MVPPHAKISIDLYIDEGYDVCGFLYAVLTNDLMEAAIRADQLNRANLADICAYLLNYAPDDCYGSANNCFTWIALHQDKPEEAKRIAAFDKKLRDSFAEPQ